MMLVDAMFQWMETTKRPILKEQAYNREIGTIRNQIGKSDMESLHIPVFCEFASEFVQSLFKIHKIVI